MSDKFPEFVKFAFFRLNLLQIIVQNQFKKSIMPHSSELFHQNVLHQPENGRAPSPHLSISLHPHPELLHFSTTSALSV